MTVWRFIAQRVPSGEFVDWNVPLEDPEITVSLSGPGRLTGRIPPGLHHLRGSDGSPLLLEWGTAIWAEADGQIRGGGILVESDFNDDGDWVIDCMGLSGYPTGLPWTGDTREWVQADPSRVFSELWAGIQATRNGDLGVVVKRNATPFRVGEPKSKDPKSQSDGPFRVSWWETHDVGRVLDDLAEAGHFDYIEDTRWDGDRLAHTLTVRYPAGGRRRDDLKFVVGVNVDPELKVSRSGGDYASDVVVLGAGEGSRQVRGIAYGRQDRVRRVAVVSRKDITSYSAAAQAAREEWFLRNGAPSVEALSVADHPHAPLGSFAVGDEIFLEGETDWFELGVWLRVVELTVRPFDASVMELTVVRVEG